MSDFKRESALVYYKEEVESGTVCDLISTSTGTPGSVEFDFMAVWRYINAAQKRGSFNYKNLHFIHVHPPGFGPGYSATDMNCVEGFIQAFGLKKEMVYYTTLWGANYRIYNVFRFGIVCFDEGMRGRFVQYIPAWTSEHFSNDYRMMLQDSWKYEGDLRLLPDGQFLQILRGMSHGE